MRCTILCFIPQVGKFDFVASVVNLGFGNNENPSLLLLIFMKLGMLGIKIDYALLLT